MKLVESLSAYSRCIFTLRKWNLKTSSYKDLSKFVLETLNNGVTIQIFNIRIENPFTTHVYGSPFIFFSFLILLGVNSNLCFCIDSEFGDIYDEDHFIRTLNGHVKVVRELPDYLMETYDQNITNIPNLRVEAWASTNYYLGHVYPLLQEQGYVSYPEFFIVFGFVVFLDTLNQLN